MNNTRSHLSEMKYTPNMYLNHLITPWKPPMGSNTITHHKSNFQHHKYLNQIKYYSSHLMKNTYLHLQEMKNTPNMYLNHLITLCKPLACSNTINHHKTNFQHHKHRVLQVFKSNRILNHIKYYSSHLMKNTHSYLQEMKKLSIHI